MRDQVRYDPLPASQWKDSGVSINSLTKRLMADEREEATDENHGPWRVAAVLTLPDNVFVWLNEFQSWYSATRPMIHRDGDSTRMSALKAEHERTDSDTQKLDSMEAELFQTADDSLCLTPILPPEIEGKIWRYAEVVVPVAATGVPFDALPAVSDSQNAGGNDSDNAEQRNPHASGEPRLRAGRNSRAAVAKWVAWQARATAAKFGNVADLAESIRLVAEKWGYESERGPMTAPSITKMIPAGLTGGRGKNRGRSKNMGRLLFES